MFRSLVAILLLLIFVTAADAAKRRKRKAPAKAKAPVETVEKAAPVAPVAKEAEEKPAEEIAAESAEPVAAAPEDEMEAYRAIQARHESTVQDLADLILMYRGEYVKFNTADKRLARARELKCLKAQNGVEKLERGTLAYAMMKIYEPESGFLFWLTGWERYAMRDVQEAGIMPTKATGGQHLSGEQLIGTITAAQEYVEGKKNWGH